MGSRHVGISETYHLVARHFEWDTLRVDVQDYVRSCQRNKAGTKAYAGILQPLPIPGKRWEHVPVNMTVKLPTTDRDHDSILVFGQTDKDRAYN